MQRAILESITKSHKKLCSANASKKQHKFLDGCTDEDIKHDRRRKIVVSRLSVSIQLHVEP